MDTPDLLHRCRWALRHGDGHPNGAWSTGEQLAVAAILIDQETLTVHGYTYKEAVQRLHGEMGMTPEAFLEWMERVRRTVLGVDTPGER